VVGDKAYCVAARNEKEVAVALDSNTGKELWATPLDNEIKDRQGGNGPRSTPAVDGDRVYYYGTYLKLTCLNAADGKVVWQKDLKEEFGGKEIGWGHAASPIIDGDLVFICAGGQGQSLLAFNKKTGEVAWKGQSDGPTHASPTPATIHGTRQVIFRTDQGLVSVVPQSGEVLWRYSFPHSVSSAASPVVGGDFVYVSSAYGVGASAAKISKEGDTWTANEQWRKRNALENHWTTPVYKDGYLYGLYKKGNGLRCIDMKTGEEKWSKGGFGWEGATTLVGDHVLVQNNRGDLVLVKATPDGYEEVARAQAVEGKAWTMATVANGRIFARSDREAVCLDVSDNRVASNR
jgi:outer membrane protein assembly factor BamB